jgi:prepilin-type N-terminal cleavage/methylation domain-containing protein
MIKTHPCRGLTLLELMVVLVILAIVSTIALQSLQPRVESQRFDSATRLLNEIKGATLGPEQKFQIDGTPLISGFVNDVGRLPIEESLLADTGNSSSNPNFSNTSVPNVLTELWSTQTQLATQYPYQFRAGPNQPTDYSSVRIPCGWRGPYLQLPIGLDSIRDPWGRAPLPIANGVGQIEFVEIELPPSPDENQPEKLSIGLANGTTQVTGKVLLDDPEKAVVQIALLSPSPETSLTTLAVLDDEDPIPDSFSFRNVPVGLRAIVCDVNGQRKIKYVQVPHSGLVVCFDFLTRETESAPPANDSDTSDEN